MPALQARHPPPHAVTSFGKTFRIRWSAPLEVGSSGATPPTRAGDLRLALSVCAGRHHQSGRGGARKGRDSIHVVRRADFSCAVLSDCRERTRAAAPETWGVAIEVPLR